MDSSRVHQDPDRVATMYGELGNKLVRFTHNESQFWGDGLKHINPPPRPGEQPS